MFDFSSLIKLRADLIESINTNDLRRLSKLLNDNQVEEVETQYINLNFIDRDGQTLMHRACRLGNLEILKILVKHGASQNIKNKDEWFPIHLATYYGHFDLVKYLINENNFKHQDLIVVYEDEQDKVRANLANNFNSTKILCNNIRPYALEAEDTDDSDASSDVDESDDDYEADYGQKNSNSLEDLINNLDLNYLKLNTSNEKLFDELLNSSQSSLNICENNLNSSFGNFLDINELKSGLDHSISSFG